VDLSLNKDTRLCISLAARPGNFGTRFQNYLYRELKLDFVYKAFQIQDIAGAITGIRALGIRGAAVSMPFKESCIALLDELDSSAEGIMSVNTIVNSDGRLRGFNTDYSAVYELLKTRKITPSSTFAIMGSGGMAKAVVCALRDAGFQRGSIVARNSVTGPAIAKQYGYEWKAELKDEKADLLVNVTPIGMAGGKESDDLPFTESTIRAAQFVFDVVAIPSETPLIRFAKSVGKPIISGSDVIVLQALEQFVLYTGMRPSPDLVQHATTFARS